MLSGFQITADSRNWTCRLFQVQQTNGLLTSATQEGLCAALLGRLYFTHPTPARNDAEVVLQLYRQGGSSALEQLEGDFALVVVDAGAGKLFARRDPLGGYPLFWTRRGEQLVLDNSVSRLAVLQSTLEINGDYLAEFLALQTYGEHEPVCEDTVYRGIHRLLPDSMLVYDANASDLKQTPCWNWLERTIDPGTDDLTGIAEAYRSTLQAAVSERLRGTTAVQLSGGMDSTSVALLALDCLAEREPAAPLSAFSLLYSELRVLSREREVISRILDEHPRLRPVPIVADHLLDFGTFADPPPHEEPWPWLSAAQLEVALAKAAAGEQAATVLTGQGSDELLDTGPYHIADLLRCGRWREAFRQARQASQAENVGLWTVLFPFGIVPLLPTWMHDGLPRWRSPGAALQGVRRNDIPPWISPEFARKHHLRDRLLARSRRMFERQPTPVSVVLNNLRGRQGDCSRWYLGLPRGIHLAHPFLDARLIRLTLGVYSRVPPLPRGLPKPLLGAAMQGVLPDFIRTRPKSGFFNEPVYRGFSRHLGELRQLVCESSTAGIDWFNGEALLSCLNQAALGIGVDRAGLDRLNLTLSLLKWFERNRSPQRDNPNSAADWQWQHLTRPANEIP